MDRLAELSSPTIAPHGVDRGKRAWPIEASIALGVLALRILYLAFVSRWELVGDEAHYWEWSRRLDWSYYTKGPGIAWAIWLSTTLFGDSAAAVRLPAAVASAIMAFAGARLARRMTNGDARAATCAAIALCLAPGLFATAQLATTDVFYAAAWTVAAACLWHAVRPGCDRPIAAWLGVGVAIGVGALFKYTALMELAGIAACLFVARRRVTWDRVTFVGLLVMLLAVLSLCSPMLWWNAHHGWPTIAHQIGRLRLPGGDESVDWAWSPLWFPTFVIAQLGLLGGVGAAMIVLSIRRSQTLHGSTATARSMLLWLSVPILVSYVMLSLFRETQGNWAIAAYPTLLVLVAIDVADATRGSTMRSLWHWYIGIGVVVGVVLLAGPAIGRLPGIGRLQAIQRLDARLTGSAGRAAEIAKLVDRVAAEGPPTLVVAKGYQEASLLAFNLPGRPTVYCAASRLGSRPNAYDYFADTDLAAPTLRGDTLILVGGDLERWRGVFAFRSIEAVPDVPRTFVGRGYGGPTVERGSP